MVKLHILVTLIGGMAVVAAVVVEILKYRSKNNYADQVVHGGAGGIAGPIVTLTDYKKFGTKTY
jgi:hypothetical protein